MRSEVRKEEHRGFPSGGEASKMIIIVSPAIARIIVL